MKISSEYDIRFGGNVFDIFVPYFHPVYYWKSLQLIPHQVLDPYLPFSSRSFEFAFLSAKLASNRTVLGGVASPINSPSPPLLDAALTA
ncbi:hypothetical protein CEXT_238481 [Caerostris extrusa]|uniref:Uncharacterized protein n=1 Tax=Caerostris extrusa TaxID=172846 RepID=A0AAV4T5D4_CAEEX|nr:hypothetical protein CEXT_238481 [Caerostris extrusa]